MTYEFCPLQSGVDNSLLGVICSPSRSSRSIEEGRECFGYLQETLIHGEKDFLVSTKFRSWTMLLDKCASLYQNLSFERTCSYCHLVWASNLQAFCQHLQQDAFQFYGTTTPTFFH